MDKNNENKRIRTTPEYAQYQRDNFWAKNEGKVAPFNTGNTKHLTNNQPPADPGALEQRAKERLSEGGWYYASSNAGQSNTHLANRQAFFRHKIIPRMLVDTNARDTAHSIWGHKASAPIGFSPIGINKIYNPAGELPVAKVAKELNLPYCLSTAGSQPIEDVGAANGEGTRFFQLYWPHDDELTVSLLQRAHDSGFSACILTVDTWQLGWRHDDVATSNYAFYYGVGADLGLSDPVFKRRLAEDGIDPVTQPNQAGAKWIDNVWHGRAWSWERLPWVMRKWKEISGGKPFAIKGIQDVRDARRCVEVGCDGIVVSNHAGRQVDGAIASLDALESIVDAVGDKIDVFYDSGVRGASDVFKALALGAKFVFIGRLWVWGLSIMGEDGVRHVMKALLADLDILMNVAGCQKVADIDRSWLESGPRAYSYMAEKSKL